MGIGKCKECGAEVSSKAKACPQCGADPRSWWYRRNPISKILIIFFGLAILAGMFGGGEEEAVSGTTTKTTLAQPTPAQKEYVDITFKKFISLFGTDGTLTDLQKDKVFESEYRGKYVKWTCTMIGREVSMYASNQYMLLDCPDAPNEPDGRTDVMIIFRKDHHDKSLLIMKDEEVTFEGRPFYYMNGGVVVGLDDGVILS